MLSKRRLGEILVRFGLLRSTDVDRVLEAMRRHGRSSKFGQMARTMGLVQEEHIFAALAVQMDLVPGVERKNLTQILELLGQVVG